MCDALEIFRRTKCLPLTNERDGKKIKEVDSLRGEYGEERAPINEQGGELGMWPEDPQGTGTWRACSRPQSLQLATSCRRSKASPEQRGEQIWAQTGHKRDHNLWVCLFGVCPSFKSCRALVTLRSVVLKVWSQSLSDTSELAQNADSQASYPVPDILGLTE